MKETGIIVSGNHPKLILDGIKTITRRTYGLEEVNKNPNDWTYRWDLSDSVSTCFSNKTTGKGLQVHCPYGYTSDRLWVRETWYVGKGYDGVKPSNLPVPTVRDNKGYVTIKKGYIADGLKPDWAGITRPSLFMPRWASRILLEITGLRAERLQDIIEEDALAEGTTVMQGTWQAMEKDAETDRLRLVGEPHPYTARYHFEALWDSLNAKRGYSWKSNPWNWAIGFKRIQS